jgi:tRNA G10  N-methylase Trm11
MPENKRMWFLLGRFADISAAEIAAFLNLSADDYSICRSFLLAKNLTHTPQELIKILGGTIKISEELFSAANTEQIIDRCIEALSGGNGKVVFGISAYLDATPSDTLQFVKTTGMTIKKNLQKNGVPARFVFNSEPTLSSVTVEKNSLVKKGWEFNIVQNDGVFIVTRTTAVQPFVEWGRRDYGRPERDDVSGMLPPKLARIMINLARQPLTAAICDPFCGSGTIINEAVDLGYTSITGSDVSDKAVADAKKNLAWLSPKKLNTVNIFQSDINDITGLIDETSVNAIVTEPYLGKPLRGRETRSELEKQATEILQIYQSAFSNFAKILSSKGTLVIVVPRFRSGSDWVTMDIKSIATRCGFASLGYTKTGSQTVDFLLYARPEQRVGREIWRFTKS